MHDIDKVIIRKIQDRPPHLPIREWNQAHRAGATCPRELAYWRLEPTKALPDDKELALYFEHGHWVEREAVSNLEKAGYEVKERDFPFEWPKMQLRGHMDGKIFLDGGKRPIEVKGYAPWVWARMNTIQDFLDSDVEYLRRVPGQLLSYILLDGKSEFGLLHLINKMNARPKTIRLSLTGDTLVWGEAMLKKLEAVNRAVKRGIPPARITYEESVCGECRFRHICLKEIRPVKGITVFRGQKYEQLLELLDARARTKEHHSRYEQVDTEIGEMVRGLKKVVCGDWIIGGQEVKVGKQIRKPYKFWRKSIINVKEANRPAE
jgi:rhodanese-related sulfurtransferase